MKTAVGLSTWGALAALLACAPSPVESATQGRAGPRAPGPGSPASALERPVLGVADDAPLPFAVLPMPGSKAALLVAQTAEEPASFVRRIDEHGVVGPILRLIGERVVAATDLRSGGTALLTSKPGRVCVRTLRDDPSMPSGGCVDARPALAVPNGDTFALFEVEVAHPPGAPATAPRQAPRHAKKDKKGATKKPPRRAPARRAPKLDVTVKMRTANADGTFTDAVATGLTFKQPGEGLRLVDGRARAGGIDLAWFEWAPERRTRSALGSARITAGRIEGGAFVRASRTPVTDGDLDYGFIQDRKAPRLVGDEASTGLVALDKVLACNAWRAQPRSARLAPNPVTCAIDPALVVRPALAQATLDALLRIEKAGARRVPGQAKTDPGLVAWAGDRAVFQHDGVLATATRAGEIRDEPSPFPAHRRRLRWGAFDADGAGVAVVGARVVTVSAAGVATSAPVGSAVHAGALVAPTTRAARIGDAWITTGGGGFRLDAGAIALPLPSGADAAGASVLVGGAEAGLLVQVAGDGGLRAIPIGVAGAGEAASGWRGGSPVRVGFDAAARASGGALVAGISAADPLRVVAFPIDAQGQLGAAHRLPLVARPGDLGVHVMPRPGGAIVADDARTMAVWIDDDARPVGAAPWPEDARAEVACVDGRAAPGRFPSPNPGVFVAIPELANACVVGEPTWTRDGALHAFVSRARGIDLDAEILVARPEIPAGVAAASARGSEPTLTSAPRGAPRCPLDMVQIGAALCVDRFEGSLVDASTWAPLSPDWPTVGPLRDLALAEWSTGRERTGDLEARAMPLPALAPPSSGGVVAVSRPLARPAGYVAGVVAERACAAAGKRLCALDEFVKACRGEDDTLFPYGDDYQDGLCNVNRDEHPAASLHDNAAIGHLDPRLNRVVGARGPLFRETGETRTCKSRWGQDGAYDLVGNVDEWVDQGGGAFAGGFYSRATKSGCEALVTAHPKVYLDYSTGIRCCKDAAP